MASNDPTSSGVQLGWGVKIPLRDGVHLNATVYTPRAQTTPAPCVVTLTPYISDTNHDRALALAGRGLPNLVVDVRGRGNSEGEFHPRVHEARDGYDVVDWAARQPFCNGQVAMRGASYGGYCQWATAKERPPALKTIVPTAAPYSGIGNPMRSNIFYPERVQWLMLTSGRALQAKLFNDDELWSATFRAWHDSGRAFRDVDLQFGARQPILQQYLDHPEPDEYWDAQNPTDAEYAALDIPVLTITGHYDDDQPGALEHYKRHVAYASPKASARHFLVIGPWDHAGTAIPTARFGGLTLSPACEIDMTALHLEWYNWVMGDGPKPEFLRKRVAYYVTGAEAWRYADSLPDVTKAFRTCFLDSRTGANDIFSSGTLSDTRGAGGPDTYSYDPANADGPEVDAETIVDSNTVVDQTTTLALRGKALFYHSAPFEADTEISGFFKLSAWISIDQLDTDFYVSVYETHLDGRALLLSTDALRARYRQGLRTPCLITTGEPLRYDFEGFTFVSRQIRRGHRLRLVVAPVGRLIASKFRQKNYNGGGVVAEETADDARPVTVRLFHDALHPSQFHIPIGRAA